MRGVDDRTPALQHNLPQSLRTLRSGACFDKALDNVTWPAGLQSLTFGEGFATVNLCRPAGHGEGFKSNGFTRKTTAETWIKDLIQVSAVVLRVQSEPGQGDMASRLSKFDFFSKFRSELWST